MKYGLDPCEVVTHCTGMIQNLPVSACVLVLNIWPPAERNASTFLNLAEYQKWHTLSWLLWNSLLILPLEWTVTPSSQESISWMLASIHLPLASRPPELGRPHHRISSHCGISMVWHHLLCSVFLLFNGNTLEKGHCLNHHQILRFIKIFITQQKSQNLLIGYSSFLRMGYEKINQKPELMLSTALKMLCPTVLLLGTCTTCSVD